MVDEYEKSVGIWTHTISDITHRIKPEEEDNLRFIRVKKNAEKAKDEEVLTKGISELYFDMVIRSDEFKKKEISLDDKQREERRKNLKVWISININQIITDMMIAYKWTTAEKLKELEERQFKIQEDSQKKKMMTSQES